MAISIPHVPGHGDPVKSVRSVLVVRNHADSIESLFIVHLEVKHREVVAGLKDQLAYLWDELVGVRAVFLAKEDDELPAGYVQSLGNNDNGKANGVSRRLRDSHLR